MFIEILYTHTLKLRCSKIQIAISHSPYSANTKSLKN